MLGAKRKFDIWSAYSLIILALFLLFLIYPLCHIVAEALTLEDGSLGFARFVAVFKNSTYLESLLNGFTVALLTTSCTLLVGIPFAYFYSFYVVKGSKLLFTISILSAMSAPFIGAYAWILLLGRAGELTKLLGLIGIRIGSIYGMQGIVLVQTTKLYPLVFLYMVGAFRNIDNTLLEASENLGCTGLKRFAKITMQLSMPTILAAALLIFMQSFADFGTPLLIGRSFHTFSVEIYNCYMSETGSDKGLACALSVAAIIITGVFFLLQKKASDHYKFSISALHPVAPKKMKLLQSILVHLYMYGLAGLSFLPNIYLVYCSFRKVKGQTLFLNEFSLDSYKKAADSMLGRSVFNTLLIGITGVAIIVIIAVIISYLTVRRRNSLNSTIDTLSMIPFIMPGSIVGIALITGFNAGIMNSGVMVMAGTYAIMIVGVVIRRMPYTIRSTTANLMQISMSIEEAAISLGASKMKTFFVITVPMLKNGVISGAILSFTAIITELSTAILLYSNKTVTLTVQTYAQVVKGIYGPACAFSAILLALTAISVMIYLKVTKMEDVQI